MSQLRTPLPVVAFVLLTGCSAEDEATSPTKTPDFAAVRADVEQFRIDNHLPGLAVAVVLDGKLAYSEALGVKSVETGEPLTPKTVVPTGSIAVKLLVAATLGQLEREGKLDLDAPMKHAVPWLNLPAGAESATLHHGLTMSSGLTRPVRKSCADPSLKAAFAELHFAAPPGHIWIYSSTGFSIGAAAIEESEKRSFEEVLLERFLGPMGLSSATFDAAVAMQGDHSASHVVSADGKKTKAYELDRLPNCDPGADCSVCEDFRANAGLYLGAEDLATLLEHIVAKQAPFDAATVDAVTLNHVSPGIGAGYDYGYGIFDMPMANGTLELAGTEYAGVTGLIAWVPGSGSGVVLLGNAYQDEKALLPRFQELAIGVARRFVDIGDPVDLSTPPGTWGKYVGKYGGPSVLIQYPYQVTLSPAGKLELYNALWDKGPVEMKQGAPSWLASGGDTFYVDDPAVGPRELTFFAGAGDGSKMQYMVDPWRFLVATRLE